MSESTVRVTVYALETGCYSDRWLRGVYGSLDEAKAAGTPSSPFVRWNGPGGAAAAITEFEWSEQFDTNKELQALTPSHTRGFPILAERPVFAPGETGRTWHSNGDWDAAATITEYAIAAPAPSPQEPKRD